MADFVIAAGRADFAVRVVLTAAGFRLATVRVREATLFAGFVAAVVRAGFARRTVFFGIAFPFAACRVREVLLFAVRVRDVAAFVSITNYPTLVEDLQKLATFG